MRTFNADACSRRNRLAALRDEVNAAPVQLFQREQREELAARKAWPAADDAMRLINSLLPDGAEPLSPDQVWVHLGEAANGAFIPSRYLFLGDTTLKNCALACNRGVAFMNSHRTGGMSHPTELPFGKTFWGTFGRDENGVGRVLFGVYMLRGVAPNGDSGPSTDDLSAMIDAGTLADVSVGLSGGMALCDLCGTNLEETDCGHVPGTTYGCGDKEKKSQKARGVPDGRATYTLVNAEMSEVSAVYDGAVPGAGFRKALKLAAHLSEDERQQAALVYHTLCRAGDFDVVPRQFASEPDGLTFEAQLETALAAVESCATRAGAVHALRAQQGRSLSAARLQQLQRLHAGLGDLLRSAEPTVQASELDILRLELECLAMGD